MKPKFNVGDTIRFDGFDFHIVAIKDGKYISDDGASIFIEYQYSWELVPEKHLQ